MWGVHSASRTGSWNDGENTIGKAADWVDLVGRRFGKLVVLELEQERDKRGRTRWRCLCNCGTTTVVVRHHLTTGNSKSCGCMRYRGRICPVGCRCARHDVRGESHPRWSSDTISYRGAHQRLGLISGRTCVDCGGPARHWSLENSTPAERLRVERDRQYQRRYSVLAADYSPRCARCHKAHDKLIGWRPWSAKLTAAQVLEARAQYRPRVRGHGTHTLAARFGVGSTTMARVLKGETWKHVKLAAG